MSRSNPTLNNPNPANKWFEWGGESGAVKYYSKAAEANFEVPLPFSFMVLDMLNTVKGYSDSDGSGIWSNEVRDISHGALKVQTKEQVIAVGKWGEISDKVKARGGKFAKSIYIAYYDEDKVLQIGNLMLKGAALSAWFDFAKTVNVEEGAIKIAEAVEATKGKTVYKVPVFKALPVSEEADEKAIELDRVLQEYLSGYLGHKIVEVEADTPAPEATVKPDLVNRAVSEAAGDVDDYPTGPNSPFVKELAEDDLPF